MGQIDYALYLGELGTSLQPTLVLRPQRAIPGLMLARRDQQKVAMHGVILTSGAVCTRCQGNTLSEAIGDSLQPYEIIVVSTLKSAAPRQR